MARDLPAWDLPEAITMPRFLRHLQPTWEQESGYGRLFEFQVVINPSLKNADRAFRWAMFRINNDKYDWRKMRGVLPRGERHKPRLSVIFKRKNYMGYIVQVRTNFMASAPQVAQVLINETNFQAINPHEITPMVPPRAKRSRRSGRVFGWTPLIPATYTPYKKVNIPYVLKVTLLPPRYGSYYGHSSYTS